MESTDPQRLGRAFAKGRAALVAYAMAGFPDRATSLAALHALADNGADLVELGVPYADPLADGPVIRDAAEVARQADPHGFGLAETIELAAEFIASRSFAPPVALMTYLNPLMRMKLPVAGAALRDAGIAGVIIPDLPLEMARPWLAASRDLDTVFLVAPTSTSERLARLGEMSTGFVYCVSTTGVTGERSELSGELSDLIARVKANTTLPVAVGFGISTPEQASIVAKLADGVVVGSAFVRRQTDIAELSAYCSSMAQAVHGA